MYDTGVPRARFKKIQDTDASKINQLMANYGMGSAPSKVGRKASPDKDGPGSDSIPKLPSLGRLTPAQQAMEARPFLPPPSPDQKVSAFA